LGGVAFLAGSALAGVGGAWASGVEPGDAVTPIGSTGGQINWTRGVVQGRGFAGPDLRAPSVTVGRIGAERAAREAASTSLCRALRAVPLEPGQNVGARQKGGPLGAKLDALCTTAARLADMKVFSDGAVEVLLEAPLSELWALAEAEGAASTTAPAATLLVSVPRGSKVAPGLQLRLVDEAGAALTAGRHDGVRYALTDAAAKRAVAGRSTAIRATKLSATGELVLRREEFTRAARDLGLPGAGGLRLVVIGDLDDKKR
jgi:hypothetical protein